MGVVIGTIAIVLASIVLGVWLDRRLGILPRKDKLLEAQRRPALPGHGPGEAPATAIRASGAALARLRAPGRCPECRTPMVADEDDQVTYEGRELVVLRFHCPRGHSRRYVYVERG
ncbi:MAG: hypothetical protein ACTHU0_28875 [Kofleriaceae bacterium]